MGWPIRKNDTGGATLVFPIYDADGDVVSGAAVLDSEISKDGGAFADVTAEATEIGASGIYSLALAQAEINANYIVTITKTTTTGAKTAVNVVYTSVRNIDDLAYPTTTGRAIDVTATGEVGLDLDNTVGTINAAQIGAAAITNAKIAADAIAAANLATGALTADAFAADSIVAATLATGALTADAFAADALVAATFATNSITADALATDALTEIRSLVSGTADSGSTATIVDAARTEGDDDYWKGCWVLITSGTAANQVRLITGFTALTDTITFAPVLTQAITTNTYEILPAGSVDLRLWAGSAPNALVVGAVDADVSALQANVITAAAIANAAIDAATFAADAIAAATIATGALTADAFAADALVAATFATGAFTADAFAADALVAATFATNSIAADALAADAVLEIADGVFKRDMDQVEATAPVHSLTSAVLKAVSKIEDDLGTLKTYRTDGITLHMSQTVATDASLDPIDSLTIGT